MADRGAEDGEHDETVGYGGVMDEPLLTGQLVFNDPRKSKTTARRPDDAE